MITINFFLQKIGKLIGPALKGIGRAFAVLRTFKPKEKDKELLDIQANMAKGFQEMHDRFDQVNRQIDVLGGKLDLMKSLGPYQDVRNSLRNVYLDFEHVTAQPSSEGYQQRFIDACRDQRVEPSQALEKLHRIIVNPGPEDLPHIIPTIVNSAKLEYKVVMGWFERITADAYQLSALHSSCFGMLYKNDTVGINETANEGGNSIDTFELVYLILLQ